MIVLFRKQKTIRDMENTYQEIARFGFFCNLFVTLGTFEETNEEMKIDRIATMTDLKQKKKVKVVFVTE